MQVAIIFASLRSAIHDVVDALVNLEHLALLQRIKQMLAYAEWDDHPLLYVIPIRNERVDTTAMCGTAANKGLVQPSTIHYIR